MFVPWAFATAHIPAVGRQSFLGNVWAGLGQIGAGSDPATPPRRFRRRIELPFVLNFGKNRDAVLIGCFRLRQRERDHPEAFARSDHLSGLGETRSSPSFQVVAWQAHRPRYQQTVMESSSIDLRCPLRLSYALCTSASVLQARCEEELSSGSFGARDNGFRRPLESLMLPVSMCSRRDARDPF